MTLGREHSPAAGGWGAAETEPNGLSSLQHAAPTAKRQRTRQPPQPIIDLSSQASQDLDLADREPSSKAAAAQAEGSLEQFQAATGRASIAAAGQKRLWGEMSSDDVAFARSMGPSSSMQWGSTRPRLSRRKRPVDAAAAAAASSPIIILDEDFPAPGSTSSMKQQQQQLQQLQGLAGHSHGQRRMGVAPLRLNPAASPPLRPRGIAANPSIAGMAAAGGPAAQAAAAHAARRRAHPRVAPAAGQRRRSNSSDSSTEQVDVDADAALARKLMQEEEDRALAQRLMREEEQAEQVRQAAADRYQAQMQAVAAAQAAAAAAGGRRGGSQRPSFQAPPGLMPPGYDPADTSRFHQQPMPAALPAAGTADGSRRPQAPPQRSFDVGQAMAHMLLSLPMPMPRWSGRGSGGSGGARRGLPANLLQMREAVIGMQRAGLPPHLLFSDRDFTADDYELLCRLDETVENRKGAASTTIDALPTQTVPAGGLPGAAAGEKLSCAVCLEEFAEGSELRCLPCLHKFHKGCIDTWLRQKASCPVCNRDCA